MLRASGRLVLPREPDVSRLRFCAADACGLFSTALHSVRVRLGNPGCLVVFEWRARLFTRRYETVIRHRVRGLDKGLLVEYYSVEGCPFVLRVSVTGNTAVFSAEMDAGALASLLGGKEFRAMAERLVGRLLACAARS